MLVLDERLVSDVLFDHEIKANASELFEKHIKPKVSVITTYLEDTPSQVQEENALSMVEDILIENKVIQEGKMFFEVGEEDFELYEESNNDDDDDINYDDDASEDEEDDGWYDDDDLDYEDDEDWEEVDEDEDED